MNREEVLERSRQENRKQDEMARDALARAGKLACAVGGLMCGLIIVLEAIFADRVNPAVWAVYLSMTGTMLTVKYARLKKKHDLVFGIAQLALAAAFLVMFIIQLKG